MKAVESIILFVSLITIGACIEEDISVTEEQSVQEFPLVDEALWSHFGRRERTSGRTECYDDQRYDRRNP